MDKSIDKSDADIYLDEYFDEFIYAISFAVLGEDGEVADKVREYSREIQRACNARLYSRAFNYLYLISKTF